MTHNPQSETMENLNFLPSYLNYGELPEVDPKTVLSDFDPTSGAHEERAKEIAQFTHRLAKHDEARKILSTLSRGLATQNHDIASDTLREDEIKDVYAALARHNTLPPLWAADGTPVLKFYPLCEVDGQPAYLVVLVQTFRSPLGEAASRRRRRAMHPFGLLADPSFDPVNSSYPAVLLWVHIKGEEIEYPVTFDDLKVFYGTLDPEGYEMEPRTEENTYYFLAQPDFVHWVQDAARARSLGLDPNELKDD